MDTDLQQMLRDQSLPLWKGDEFPLSVMRGIPTGFSELNALLPQQGFASGTILEIIYPQQGSGELRLLFPTLAYYTQQRRYLAWIAPPHIPYSPALALHGIDPGYINVLQPQSDEQQHYWCMEKLLACNDCGTVLFWPRNLLPRNIRRLQLAASKASSLGILLYPHHQNLPSSPAATRLRIETMDASHVRITLLKARGLINPASTYIRLPL